jgi:hypothetical protein
LENGDEEKEVEGGIRRLLGEEHVLEHIATSAPIQGEVS